MFIRNLFLLGPLALVSAWAQSDNEALARKIAAEKVAIAVAGKPGAESIEWRTVKGAPYTAVAVTTTTQTLADGNRIVRTMESKIARDSEGRTRREQDMSAVGQWATKESGVITYIQDPVAQTRYVIPPDGLVAMKSSLNPSADKAAVDQSKAQMIVMKEKARAEANSKAAAESAYTFTLGKETKTFVMSKDPVEDLGTQIMENVRVEGKRTVHTIPAGDIGNERPIKTISETWYSPELQMIVSSKRSDPRIGETEYRLTNIQRAEPPHSLFEPPPGYTIQEEKGVKK